MKAVVIKGYGGVEVLEARDVPKPALEPGHVLVKVVAASVNPIDWKIRNGSMKLFIRKKPPFILGADVAGEIAEVASGSKFSVGAPVYTLLRVTSGGMRSTPWCRRRASVVSRRT